MVRQALQLCAKIVTSSASKAIAIQMSPKNIPRSRARHDLSNGSSCHDMVVQKFRMLSILPCRHPREHFTDGAHVRSITGMMTPF
eukprot:6518373-Karenia_brevis.AAC.1